MAALAPEGGAAVESGAVAVDRPLTPRLYRQPVIWPEPPIDPKDVPRLLELCAGEREWLEALVGALTATLIAQPRGESRPRLPP
jgi:hypothetical protein